MCSSSYQVPKSTHQQIGANSIGSSTNASQGVEKPSTQGLTTPQGTSTSNETRNSEVDEDEINVETESLSSSNRSSCESDEGEEPDGLSAAVASEDEIIDEEEFCDDDDDDDDSKPLNIVKN